MSVLIAVSLIVLALYAAWLPSRETDAATVIEDKTATRGAHIFAQNCRLCHGDVAEGGALGARLPAAPALDRPDLQGFIDSNAKLNQAAAAADTAIRVSDPSKFKTGQTILVNSERMEIKSIDAKALTVARALARTEASPHSADSKILIRLDLDSTGFNDKVKLITNTITCGRVGSPMPAWGQSQGGILSDEQIRQLMVLITTGRWELVREEDDKADILKTALTEDVDEDRVSLRVTDVTAFSNKDAIRIGDERLRVTAVPKVPPIEARKPGLALRLLRTLGLRRKAATTESEKSGIILVQRGVLGTAPLAHTADEVIFKFPETSEPSINQSSCGQTAKPQGPTLPPGPKPCADPCQTVPVAAQGVQFTLPEIRVKAGGNVRLAFDNRDQGTQHNLAVYKSSTDIIAVASGSVGTTFTGPGNDEIVFALPAAGTFYFRCDTHPTSMFGSFVVTP